MVSSAELLLLVVVVVAVGVAVAVAVASGSGIVVFLFTVCSVAYRSVNISKTAPKEEHCLKYLAVTPSTASKPCETV